MKSTFAETIADLTDADAFPADASESAKKSITNEALEAVLLTGRWNGSQQELALSVNTLGDMTLPRQFLTVKAAIVDEMVREMASPWFAYLPGTSTLTAAGVPNVQDRGDGFCTFRSIETSSTLSVSSTSSSDDAATLVIRGYNAGNDAVTETLTVNGDVGTVHFATVTEIVKPVTVGIVSLLAASETIGIYEAGETVPNYRRYYVPELANSTDGGTVTALCQRRHVKLVADNDIVPISNFRALKNAVLSIVYEGLGDETRSEFHMTRAINFLNGELKLLRPPAEQGRLRVSASNCGATNLRAQL